MSPTTSIRPMTEDDRPLVERLWQLYAHDLSEFRGWLPDGDGLYPSGRLPLFFDDPDRCGYLVCRGAAVVGFALVRDLSGDPRVLGEFFVVRAARRLRVGQDAALAVLRAHPGRWEIAFQEDNPGAARFWRRVATEAVGSAWTEERRPIPGKPAMPYDTWLALTTCRRS